MNRRVKRRLWLLSIMIVVCITVVVTWLLFASWNRERRIQTSITEGMAAYRQGDYVNSLNILRYAVTHRGDDKELLLAFADSRIRNIDPRGKKGHVQNSIKYYERVLQLDPNNQEAAKALFRIYSTNGRISDAISISSRLEELDEETLIKKARLQERYGQIEGAFESLQTLRERDPDASGWVINEFEVRRRLGEEPEEMLSEFDALAAQYPENQALGLVRIILLRNLKRVSEAREAALELCSYEQIDPALLIDLRNNLIRMGMQEQFDQVQDRIEIAATQDPDHAFNLMKFDWRRGAVGQARLIALDAATHFPDDLRFLRTALLLNRIEPDPDISSTKLEESLISKSESIDTAGAILDEAIVDLIQSLHPESGQSPQEKIARIGRVRVLDDTGSYMQFMLIFEGMQLEEMGRSRSAIEVYKSAFENNDSRLAGKRLVEAYLRDQEFEQAVRVSSRMYTLFPSVDSSELELRSLLMLNKSGRKIGLSNTRIQQAGSLSELIRQNYLTWKDRGENATRLLPILAQASLLEEKSDALQYAQEEALASSEINADDLLRILQIRQDGDGPTYARLIEHARKMGAPEFDLRIAEVIDEDDQVQKVRGLFELELLAREMPEGSEQRKFAFRDLIVQHSLVPVPWENKLEAIRAIRTELEQDIPTARFLLNIPDIWTKDPTLAAESLEVLKLTLGADSPVYTLADARRLLQDPQTSQRERARAVVAVDRVIKESSSSIQACLVMTDLLQSGSNPDLSQAVIYLRRVIDLRPDLVSLYPTAIELLQKTGDGALALEYLDQYRKLRIEDEAITRLRAKILARQGDVSNAVDEFDRLIRKSNNMMDRIYLGGLLAQIEMNEEAIAQYQLVLDQDPENILALLRKATTLATMGRIEEARAFIGEFANLSDDERLRYEILVDRAGGQSESALEKGNRLVALEPGDVKSWLTLYEILPGTENQPRRIEALNRVIEIDPENIDGLTNLANEYMVMGGATEQARDVIEMLSESMPGRGRILQVKLDSIDPETGLLQPGSKQLDMALKLADEMPTNPDAHKLAWELHRAHGSHDKALRIAKNSVVNLPASLQPHQWAIESALAALYWDEAIALAETARGRLSPSDRAMHDLKTAELCLALGYESRAVRSIERFLPYIQNREQIFIEAGSMARVPVNFPEMLRMTAMKSLIAADRSDTAFSLFEPLLESTPEIMDLWVIACRSADPYKARQGMLKVIPMLENSPEGRMTITKALVSIAERSGDASDIDRAKAAIQRVRELNPEEDHRYMNLYEATLLARLEEYEKSTETLEQLISEMQTSDFLAGSDPDRIDFLTEAGWLDLYVTALNNLAYMYATLDDESRVKAMDAVTEALSLAPPQYRAALLDTKALIESRNLDCISARNSIEDAIDLRPGNVDYQIRLARILMDCGDYVDAESTALSIRDGLLAAPETDIEKMNTITQMIDDIQSNQDSRRGS